MPVSLLGHFLPPLSLPRPMHDAASLSSPPPRKQLFTDFCSPLSFFLSPCIGFRRRPRDPLHSPLSLRARDQLTVRTGRLSPLHLLASSISSFFFLEISLVKEIWSLPFLCLFFSSSRRDSFVYFGIPFDCRSTKLSFRFPIPPLLCIVGGVRVLLSSSGGSCNYLFP